VAEAAEAKDRELGLLCVRAWNDFVLEELAGAYTDIRVLFAGHVYGTFIEDQASLRLLDVIGEDNVMPECDYSHSDSTWPARLRW
jgi:hypothetical protein